MTWWSAIFADLAVEPEDGGTTLVSGELPDQAALHGLLAAIRDLGLTLESVETAASPDVAEARRSAVNQAIDETTMDTQEA